MTEIKVFKKARLTQKFLVMVTQVLEFMGKTLFVQLFQALFKQQLWECLELPVQT